MTYPFTQRWTLIRKASTGRDGYGDDVATETQTAISVVFAPGGSSEITNESDVVTTEPTLYGWPSDVDVNAVDAVEAPDGTRYEVDGEPQSGYASPFSDWQPGTVVKLRRVTG